MSNILHTKIPSRYIHRTLFVISLLFSLVFTLSAKSILPEDISLVVTSLIFAFPPIMLLGSIWVVYVLKAILDFVMKRNR